MSTPKPESVTEADTATGPQTLVGDTSETDALLAQENSKQDESAQDMADGVLIGDTSETDALFAGDEPDAADPEDAQSELAFTPPDPAAQERMVEAMLFSSIDPLSTADIQKRLPKGSDAAEALRALEARYADRGVNVFRVAGKWALRTSPDLGFLLRREETANRKLSRAAIETLAIIAYHQPATRAEIEEIRGVAVSKGTIDLLLEMEWVKLGRRRETPGRPVTFITTDGFLDHFGLESTRDLPGLEELKAAGLLESKAGGDALSLPTDTSDEDVDDGDVGMEEDDGDQPDLI